ncbi:MAG: hypothetical protein IID37_03685 [Planctomycetes bacterium]|nr:hypothetical protein [Planctomycetota bacterium]
MVSGNEKWEVPTPDGDQAKEVYAFFGLAAYTAQVVEAALLNLLVGLELARQPTISRQQFEQAFDQADKKTLGQLLRKIGSQVPLGADVESVLGEALDARNYLCHRFFGDHAEDFLSAVGRREMIAELRELTEKIHRADRFYEVTVTLFERIGVSVGMVEKYIAESTKRAKWRDDGDDEPT